MITTLVLLLITLGTIQGKNVIGGHQDLWLNGVDIKMSPQKAFQNSGICGQARNSVNTRIINGHYASNCQFPWMVSIVKKHAPYIQTNCGGTIIGERHILTAAHCFFIKNKHTGGYTYLDESQIVVLSGSSYIPKVKPLGRGTQVRTIAQIKLHENYIYNKEEYDIAILELTKPIVFNECEKPLCLINGRKPVRQATNCLVMGWGLTANSIDTGSEKLKYTELDIMSDYVCKGTHGVQANNLFCAGFPGRNSCNGDSGGPLTCRESDGKYYIYGIVHGGPIMMCGLFASYTRVSSFLGWIQSNTI